MSRLFSAMSRNHRVFPGKISKCPDSRNNFGIVPKQQRLLELSHPRKPSTVSEVKRLLGLLRRAICLF